MRRALEPLVLVGGGGHASDVLQGIEAINAADPTWKVLGILDDGEVDRRRFVDRDVELLGPIAELGGLDARYVVTIGWPWARRLVTERLPSTARAAPPLVHPAADVGRGVELGEGTVVLGNSHLSPMVRLGRHSLVSYQASVGHDTVFGDFATVMPGAAVSGDVVGGDDVLVGTGAAVREGVRLGSRCRIGAGAGVISDVRDDCTVAGVPARPIS